MRRQRDLIRDTWRAEHYRLLESILVFMDTLHLCGANVKCVGVDSEVWKVLHQMPTDPLTGAPTFGPNFGIMLAGVEFVEMKGQK